MKFLDVLKKVDIKEVLRYINLNYEDNSDDAYLNMYRKLVFERKAVDVDDLILFVVPQKEYFKSGLDEETTIMNDVSDLENLEEHLEVLGYSEKDNEDYALDFNPWDEWLGMTVSDKSVELLGEVVFAAECLREMSFISFDEDKIEDLKDSLADIVMKINIGEEKTYSQEEMDEYFREKFGEPFMPPEKSPEEKEEDSRRYKLIHDYNMNKRNEYLGVEREIKELE